eukprot:TRINITY_DN5199_c0_g1_i1.p1 TRINITY_DN5199_c0_g1~~TRINITY_DN5199_c0_g1_i1.p1  ORF type:complete len:948 (+),score=143.20 TRINITY_DN5199_c0_g1_i1:179-3022(+)
MEPPEETELDLIGQYEPKKHNTKHKKNALSDESHHRSAEDLSDRRSVPSRTTSPKSDLEDGWNLVEDDLPERSSPEPHGATPSKDTKRLALGEKPQQHGQQHHGGHNTSNSSWNSNFRTKVYCSLYNMYHSQPTEPPSFSSSPIWMMGQQFVPHPDDIFDGAGSSAKKSKGSSKRKVPEHAERFMETFVNILFFSYRKDFPKLNHLHTTTDVGWGCMVRTGQMILAHVLNELHSPRLNRERINPQVSPSSTYASARMPYSRERQILKLFHDSPDDGVHPYSIHAIIDRNSALYGIEKKDEQKNGIWFSPTKIAKVLKHLVRRSSPDSLTMLVPNDGVIYADKVIELCTAPFVPHTSSTSDSKISAREARKRLRRSGKYAFPQGVTPAVEVRRIHKHELLASAAEPIVQHAAAAAKETAPPHDSVSESWIDVGAPPSAGLKHPTPLRRNASWNPFKSRADDFEMDGSVDHGVADDEHSSTDRSRNRDPHSQKSSRSSSRSRASSKKSSRSTRISPSSSDAEDEEELDVDLETMSDDTLSSLDTSDEGPDPDEDRYVFGPPSSSSGTSTPTRKHHAEDDAIEQQPSSIRKTKSSILSPRSSPSPRRTPPLAGGDSSAFGTFSLSQSSDAVVNPNGRKGDSISDSSNLGSFSMTSDDSTSDFHVMKRGVSFQLPDSATQPDSPAATRPRYWSIKYSTTPEGDEGHKPTWRPVFILIPRRLGVSKLNPIFIQHLKATFRNPYSVGIVGGKPKASLYFVAYQDDDILYLDPHIVRSAHHDDDEFTDEVYNSYHVKIPQKMPFSSLDPSMAIGFLCRTLEEFEDFCNIHEQFLEESRCDPIFTIEERAPDYGVDQSSASSAREARGGTKSSRRTSSQKATSSSSSRSQRDLPNEATTEKKQSMRRSSRSKSPESKHRSRVDAVKESNLDRKARSEGGSRSPPHLSDEDDFVHT